MPWYYQKIIYLERKSSSDEKFNTIFEIFEKKRFNLTPHTLPLGLMITKLEISLTESLVMIKMTNGSAALSTVWFSKKHTLLRKQNYLKAVMKLRLAFA